MNWALRHSLTVFVALCFGTIASADPRSGGPVNFLPVFVGAPYPPLWVDYTQPGGTSFVFRGTVTDANPADIITMRGFLFGTPFTFDYTPGNPAQFELRGSNLGPANFGAYGTEFDAYDTTNINRFATATLLVFIVPEPGVLVCFGFGPIVLARRGMHKRH
jgi:amino acid transporter